LQATPAGSSRRIAVRSVRSDKPHLVGTIDGLPG
jgi:hypothetical protein